MEKLLTFIADKMEMAGIPYEFGEWTGAVSYPYCVGTYSAEEYRYEDECTNGTLTVDIWSRESKLSAVQMADRIAAVFEDLQEVRDDLLFFVRCTGADTIPSGEMDLFRIEVRLSVSVWKAEYTGYERKAGLL